LVPDQKPVQNTVMPSAAMANFTKVVPAITAPPGGAPQHVSVLGPIAGDVVLAGFGAAFGHLAGQQRVLACQQGAQAAHLAQRDQQAAQQAVDFGRRVRRQQAVDQLLHASRAAAQLVQAEDDVHRHAVLFQMRHHAVRGTAAGVQQGAQVGGFLQCIGLPFVLQRGAQPARAGSKLAEGLVLQQHGFHALAQQR
jgi:hypothetical protein